MKHILSFLAIVSVATTVVAERQPFSRYQSIVERQMFGELPAGFDPTKMPNEVVRSSSSKQGPELTKEQEKLQSSIHFSAINVTPEGATAVGFTDNSNPKAPVHYYLKVGEMRDGWKVLEADAKTASMTIAKGDIEVSLSLGGNSGNGAGQTKSRAAESSEQQAGGSSMLRTLRGRRALREKREADAFKKFREEQEAKEAKEAEAKAEREAEREEQREAEREEQRKQLMAIQEELRKAREEKAQQRKQQEAEENADNETE